MTKERFKQIFGGYGATAEMMVKSEKEFLEWIHSKCIESALIRCGECVYYNAETKGCKRNPSVEAWEENDYCSHWVDKGVYGKSCFDE